MAARAVRAANFSPTEGERRVEKREGGAIDKGASFGYKTVRHHEMRDCTCYPGAPYRLGLATARLIPGGPWRAWQKRKRR